jgi:hypothetical protein
MTTNGNGRKGRRPTLNTEGSGTHKDNGNCNCEREEGFIAQKASDGEPYFAPLRMTSKGNGNDPPTTCLALGLGEFFRCDWWRTCALTSL